MAGPTACKTRWSEILASFQRKIDKLTGEHPECIGDIKLIHYGLITIGQLIHISPRVNGNGAQWKAIITRAKAEMAVLCKHLEGQALFTGMLRLCTAIHRELCDSLKREEQPSEEFCEQRRRKRNPSEQQPTVPKEAVTAATSAPKITTRNFFAPLRATMETDSSGMEDKTEEEAVAEKTCRPPPIILTSTVNLIQLQKHLKSVVKGDFEFRSTRNGTRVITKDMADFEAVKSHFTNNKPFLLLLLPEIPKTYKSGNTLPPA
jgi:hypothetical protein